MIIKNRKFRERKNQIWLSLLLNLIITAFIIFQLYLLPTDAKSTLEIIYFIVATIHLILLPFLMWQINKSVQEQDEKREQRKFEAEKENNYRETILFQIKTFNEVRKQILTESKNKDVRGVRCFRHFLLEFQEVFLIIAHLFYDVLTHEQKIKLAWRIFYYGYDNEQVDKIIKKYLKKEKEEIELDILQSADGTNQLILEQSSDYKDIIDEFISRNKQISYNEFIAYWIKLTSYRGHQSQLGVYFRNINQIFTTTEFIRSANMLQHEIDLYEKSLKNLLNDNELAIYALNVFCYIDSEVQTKMVQRINKVHFFRNLMPEFIFGIDHRFLFPDIFYECDNFIFSHRVTNKHISRVRRNKKYKPKRWLNDTIGHKFEYSNAQIIYEFSDKYPYDWLDIDHENGTYSKMF